MEASAEDKARGKGVLAGLGTGVVSQQGEARRENASRILFCPFSSP